MAEQWLTHATGQGEWISECGKSRGYFVIEVNTDRACVKIYYDDGDAAPLFRYSLEYLQDGFAICVRFEREDTKFAGVVDLDGDGKLEGHYTGPDGASGHYIGTSSPQLRPYVEKLPMPDKRVKKHLADEPCSMEWKAPACLHQRTVVVVGIGGASRSGKSSLAKVLADEYKARGIQVAIVPQDQFDWCAGMYHLPDGGVEAMYETPCSLRWNKLGEALAETIESVKSTADAVPGLVIVEGFLLYWIAELSQIFDVRLFLRASRTEVFRRRQASTRLHPSFLEHVFWPAHLRYGQPQAPVYEYEIPDGQPGYPVPSNLLENAMADINSNIPALNRP